MQVLFFESHAAWKALSTCNLFWKYDNRKHFLIKMYANFEWVLNLFLGGEEIFFSNLSGENRALHNFRLKTSCVVSYYCWFLYLFSQCLRADFFVTWKDKTPWKKCEWPSNPTRVQCNRRNIQPSLLPLPQPCLAAIFAFCSVLGQMYPW